MLIYSFSLQYVFLVSIKSLPFNIVLTLVYLILLTPVLPVLQRSVFYPALGTSVLPVFQLQLVQDSKSSLANPGNSSAAFTPAIIYSWLHHSLIILHLVYIMLIYSFSLWYVLLV